MVEEQEVATHSDNKWPSWQSNSISIPQYNFSPQGSQICHVFLYFTSENKRPHFGLSLKLKKICIYSGVNKSQKVIEAVPSLKWSSLTAPSIPLWPPTNKKK